MDSAKAKELLEKFYRGETTPDEERALRAYFRAPEHPGPDAQLFHIMEGLKVPLPGDLAGQLSDGLEKAWEHQSRARFIRITQWATGIAAALIIAFLLPFLRQPETRQPLADTYHSPEEAYGKTREVLLFISATMNRQTAKLQSLSAMDKALDKAAQLKKVDQSINAAKNEND